MNEPPEMMMMWILGGSFYIIASHFQKSEKILFSLSFYEPVSGWCLLIIPLGNGLWAFISFNFRSKPTWFTIQTIYHLVRKKWVKGISEALFPLTVIKWVCFISLFWGIFHNLKDFLSSTHKLTSHPSSYVI